MSIRLVSSAALHLCLAVAGAARAQPLETKADSPIIGRFSEELPDGVVRRFGSLRFRHASGFEPISRLAFSADGERIASVGPDHTVRVWDLDGREVMRLVGDENGRFRSVTFSPDGGRLAARSEREMRVWDAATGALSMRVLVGSGGPPVFSSGGKQVATTNLLYTPMAGYLKRSFDMWDAGTGRPVHSLDSSRDWLWPMAVAVDRGLTASRDHRDVARPKDARDVDGVRIRRLDTGKAVVRYDEHAAAPQSVAFSPDGMWAASSCLHDGVLEIHRWDPLTGETKARHRAKTSFAAYELSASPDGRTLLGVASVRDFDGGYADGEIAVDTPARVELLAAATCRPRHRIDDFAAPALSPDGRILAAARFDRIQLFDARTGKPLEEYPGHDAPVQGVAASRDGRRFASVGRDHTVRIWDAATGAQLSLRRVEDGIDDASFSGDLRRVTVLHGVLRRNGRRRVTVWDESHDEPVFDLAVPDGDRRVAISGDGTTLASWGKGDLRVWNLETGKESMRIESVGLPNVINGFALSDDGRRVTAGISGEPIRTWDTRSGERLVVLEPNVERMLIDFGGPLSISPDGRRLATRREESIAIYDLATGARVDSFPRQTTGYVAEFAYSPDGRLLASSARDGSIRLLDASTGDVLADLRTGWPGWTSIAFTPDGNRLLAGGGAAVLELWDITAYRDRVERE